MPFSALFPAPALIAAAIFGAAALIWRLDHATLKGEIATLEKCLRDVQAQKQELLERLEESQASVIALQGQARDAWAIAEESRKKAHDRAVVISKGKVKKAAKDEVLDEPGSAAALAHIAASLDGLRK